MGVVSERRLNDVTDRRCYEHWPHTTWIIGWRDTPIVSQNNRAHCSIVSLLRMWYWPHAIWHHWTKVWLKPQTIWGDHYVRHTVENVHTQYDVTEWGVTSITSHILTWTMTLHNMHVSHTGGYWRQREAQITTTHIVRSMRWKHDVTGLAGHDTI